MLKQNFAKINSEANHWPSTEVEWVEDLELSKKLETKMVIAMNVYGALAKIPYKDLTFHFEDSYVWTPEPLVLNMRSNHLYNVLLHYTNTGENILNYTLHIPKSWISIPDAMNVYLNEIGVILSKLKQDENLEYAHYSLMELVSNYKYRLGLIKVQFI